MANAGTRTTPGNPGVDGPAPVKAVARYVRVAPNKVRQVIAHIRGLDVEEARRILLVSPKGAAEPVRKVLESAVANAEHNAGLDADRLVVAAVYVNEGPMLKRYQPRAMGRAYRIRKRTSHITVEVAEAPARQVAAPAAPAKGKSRGKAAGQAETGEKE